MAHGYKTVSEHWFMHMNSQYPLSEAEHLKVCEQLHAIETMDCITKDNDPEKALAAICNMIFRGGFLGFMLAVCDQVYMERHPNFRARAGGLILSACRAGSECGAQMLIAEQAAQTPPETSTGA